MLDVVALLADRAADGLARGQVGTVVESFGDDSVLVEFSDDDGRSLPTFRAASSPLCARGGISDSAKRLLSPANAETAPSTNSPDNTSA